MAKVELSGRLVAVPLDDPALVVGPLERDERQAELLDGLEAAHPQQVLLQGPDEPLGAAVALRLAHEGRRALDAEEADLGLEVVAHVLAPVVVAQPQAGGDVLGERAAALAHPPLDPPRRPPGASRPACLTGSSASKRSARRLAWTPTHSAEQWSTATNTAAWPSPVITEVRSVPHIRSTRAVVIVPSWAFGPRGWPARWWASRPCSRVSRRTRRRLVRMPAQRRRAHSLRWAPPGEGA